MMRGRHFGPSLPRWQRRTLRVVLGVGMALVLALPADAVWPAPYDRVPQSFVLTDRKGTLLHARLAADGQWRLPAQEIPPRLRAVLLAKEDKWFGWHPGVNPVAIARAAAQNVFQGRRVSGASTLTMQVARMLEPGPRTPLRKLREMLRALQLAWHLPDDELLRLYLTLVPYGGNIQGLEAGSRMLLGKPPAALSWAECVTLVLIPNNPNGLGLYGDRPRLLAQRNTWLQRLTSEGVIPAAELPAALAEPLDIRFRPLPREAPHLALWLASQSPQGGHVISTLDNNLQAKAHQLVGAFSQRIQPLGIGTAAALVVDNRTRAVRAYVGSADFNDIAQQGQVDGVRAVRSPGSALKPLLYALALDQGLVSPATVVADVPTNFGGYSPENYDETFRGQVDIRTALALSLNVPAVRVLDAMGPNRMTDALARAEFQAVKANRKRLGLSLVLGGCGVRMTEMAALYAALADSGRWRPLRFREDTSAPDSTRQLVSPQAAWLVMDMLQSLVRPDLPNAFANAATLPRIAWKTGTSYGRRDAWAIGSDAQWTIAVWLGNFDGRGAPALSGADIATPLLFQLFHAVSGTQQMGFRKPRGLVLRSVCTETGLPPDTFCTSLTQELALPGISPSRRCQHMRVYWTNTAASLHYCSHCRPATAVRRLYPDPPPELARWRLAGLSGNGPPPHNPACAVSGTSQEGLRIVSPAAGAEYLLDRLSQARLALTAQAPADTRELHWFAGDRYLGASPPGQPFFLRPDSGQLRIAVTDDKGRRATATVRIRKF